MWNIDDAIRRLCDPTSEVSSHYLVHENGQVFQLVPEAYRAWHTGVSSWANETDMNSCSIGIEIAHPGRAESENIHLGPYPDAQIEAVIALSRDIIIRWKIPANRVLGHSDIAPLRKSDPGETFPWQKLHKHGVGHWVPPHPLRGGRFLAQGDSGQPVEALQAMFALYGYGISVSGVFDATTQAVVSAFQRHFRQERVDGVADASTIETLRDLIASQPQG